MDYLATNLIEPADLREKIIKAKATGAVRNAGWLQKLAERNKLRDVDAGDAPALGRQMASMFGILDAHFPERWDIDLWPSTDRDDGLRLTLTLGWPELEISNSMGERHTVKDLYVNLSLVDNSGHSPEAPLCITKVQGTRATLTRAEWLSQYQHSHLPRHRPPSPPHSLELQEFCLGRVTELRLQMESLIEEYTENGFELLLLTLDSTVRWESLEGTPHIRMHSIRDAPDGSHANMTTSLMRDAYRLVRQCVDRPDIDFCVANGKYAIVDNEKFGRMLRRAVDANPDSEVARKVLVHRSGDHYCWPASHNAGTSERDYEARGRANTYQMRDREVKLVVEGTEQKNPEQLRLIVHPRFKEHAKEQLESEIYRAAVRKRAHGRHD